MMSASNFSTKYILACIVLDLIMYDANCSTTDSYSTLSTCINETECLNTSEKYELISESSTSENSNFVTEMINDEWDVNPPNAHTPKKVNVSTIFPSFYPSTTTSSHSVNNLSNYSIAANVDRQPVPIIKRNIDPCTCDFQMLRCDINCCCDNDCTDFHLSVFSHCSDHKRNKYDSRYCYTKEFIRKNNTEFILERIADNLFCISYDNLPPIYSKSSAIKVTNRAEFDEILKMKLESQFTWSQETYIPIELNMSNPYKDGDILWTEKSKYFNPLELPKKGFSSHCSHRKKLTYLRNSNFHCLQSKLNINNTDLFTDAYNNFTIISSPIFLNSSLYVLASNQSCPKNICIPIETTYCLKKWSMCNSTSKPASSCENGTCKNVVERILYKITHNGTMGIQRIQLSIIFGNFSTNFYQHFEVKYEWAGFSNEEVIYISGKPGYITGKPIIVGTLMKSTSKSIITEFIFVNKTDYQLTVPLAESKESYCSNENRYAVKFNEDLKSKCLISLETNNLTVDTCDEINRKVIATYFQHAFINITSVEGFKLFISKTSNITNNNVTSWNQILLNKLPARATGQKTDHKISCWNLTTSVHIDILYSLLPKPDDDTAYHKIVGVAITLNERNFSLSKCPTINCTDKIDHEINSFVKFHDVSAPDNYYFAGGPNLDISLPYDFFYPFMSASNSCQCDWIIIIIGLINVIFYRLII